MRDYSISPCGRGVSAAAKPPAPASTSRTSSRAEPPPSGEMWRSAAARAASRRPAGRQSTTDLSSPEALHEPVFCWKNAGCLRTRSPPGNPAGRRPPTNLVPAGRPQVLHGPIFAGRPDVPQAVHEPVSSREVRRAAGRPRTCFLLEECRLPANPFPAGSAPRTCFPRREVRQAAMDLLPSGRSGGPQALRDLIFPPLCGDAVAAERRKDPKPPDGVRWPCPRAPSYDGRCSSTFSRASWGLTFSRSWRAAAPMRLRTPWICARS